MAEVLHDWLNPGLEFEVFYYRLVLATADAILDAEINFLGMDDEVIDKDAFLCNLRDDHRRGEHLQSTSQSSVDELIHSQLQEVQKKVRSQAYYIRQSNRKTGPEALHA